MTFKLSTGLELEEARTYDLVTVKALILEKKNNICSTVFKTNKKIFALLSLVQ